MFCAMLVCLGYSNNNKKYHSLGGSPVTNAISFFDWGPKMKAPAKMVSIEGTFLYPLVSDCPYTVEMRQCPGIPFTKALMSNRKNCAL